MGIVCYLQLRQSVDMDPERGSCTEVSQNYEKRQRCSLHNNKQGNSTVTNTCTKQAIMHLLLAIVRLSRKKKKTNPKPADLNYSIDQINLKDIYRTVHPTAIEYICSSPHMNILRNRAYVDSQNKL